MPLLPHSLLGTGKRVYFLANKPPPSFFGGQLLERQIAVCTHSMLGSCCLYFIECSVIIKNGKGEPIVLIWCHTIFSGTSCNCQQTSLGCGMLIRAVSSTPLGRRFLFLLLNTQTSSGMVPDRPVPVRPKLLIAVNRPIVLGNVPVKSFSAIFNTASFVNIPNSLAGNIFLLVDYVAHRCTQIGPFDQC